MSNEDFEKMVKDANDMEFANEEEATAYFEEKLKARSRKVRDRRKPDLREKTDPYYKMLKNEMETIKPVTDSNELEVDANDFFKMNDDDNKNIGRYPKNYRHYENYENYKVHNPSATLQNYHDESTLHLSFNTKYSEQRN